MSKKMGKVVSSSMSMVRSKIARSLVSKWAIDHGVTYEQGLDILSDFLAIRKIWEFQGIDMFLTAEIDRLNKQAKRQCSTCLHCYPYFDKKGPRCLECYHQNCWEPDTKKKG